MNELAQRLKGARKESGLSQERLAEAVGVSGHAVYLFERGKNRPALDTLERIAAATDRDLAWFFQDEDAAQA
jgi:transcriptional regulator with XRE-family HTH domain